MKAAASIAVRTPPAATRATKITPTTTTTTTTITAANAEDTSRTKITCAWCALPPPNLTKPAPYVTNTENWPTALTNPLPTNPRMLRLQQPRLRQFLRNVDPPRIRELRGRGGSGADRRVGVYVLPIQEIHEGPGGVLPVLLLELWDAVSVCVGSVPAC